ncbi:MAG: hypothetical protein ACRC80_01660 [Waterburya sp.]
MTTAFQIPKAAQDAFLDYHKYLGQRVSNSMSFRDRMVDIDRSYLREKDLSKENLRAQLANYFGNPKALQNITIPVIKPQIVSAVAYQVAVFLTDYPIFGVVASPEYQDAAAQMQAIIEENSIRGGWAQELLLYFYDGFKYNRAALEGSWEQVVTQGVTHDPSFNSGKQGKPVDVIWSGNKLKRWNMYNTYYDMTCELKDIPTMGDFVGNTVLMTRTYLKSFINSLPSKIISNIQPAFQSKFRGLNSSVSGSYDGTSFYVPKLIDDPTRSDDPENLDWVAWITASPQVQAKNLNHQEVYEVSTEYVRIIPTDFDLRVPSPNHPQIWKLIYVNHEVLIFAEQQTNAHEKIPVFFAAPAEDGLGYQAKSLAEDGKPFQSVASSLMNSVIASRRRAINDRVLYNPLLIDKKHIENPDPSAKIPVRPAAMGRQLAEAVYQFPYRDDQSGNDLSAISQVVQFSNVLNSQNSVRQGQFVKGNKTDSQWESTMSSATSKDQMTALLLEAQVFTPLKEVLKLNILQYQSSGEIYSPNLKTSVKVDPVTLRQSILNFKVTDGLTPKEKVISSDTRKTAMQVIGSSPQLSGAYNIGPMFSYIMKTENCDLTAFEKTPQQIQFEQAQQQWSMMAQMAIEKGAPFNAPQPTPEQFGYVPGQLNTPQPNTQATQ